MNESQIAGWAVAAFAALGGGTLLLNLACAHTPQAVKYLIDLLLGNKALAAVVLAHRKQIEVIFDTADKAADTDLDNAAAAATAPPATPPTAPTGA